MYLKLQSISTFYIMLSVYLKRLYIIKNSSVYECVFNIFKPLRKTLKNKIDKTPGLHLIYILLMKKENKKCI